MTKVIKNDTKHEKTLKIISSKLKKLKADEIELFFRAFLTPNEILGLCDRYLIVKKLLNGDAQRKIAQDLGVSISKITSGSRELKFNYGKDIYEKFIKG